MDDVKNQFKGLVKKFNNPFASSSSSRFKGEGHKLGSGQNSTQQKPPSQQQGDWRKVQQERWEKERSPHPTTRQDGSQPSSASPARFHPSKSPISNDSSAPMPISSLDASSMLPNNGPYEVSICNAFQDQNLGDVNISDAGNSENDHGSDPGVHGSQAQKIDDVLLSGSDDISSSKDEAFDSRNSNDINDRLSEPVAVPINNSNVGLDQNGRMPMFDPFSPHIGSVSSDSKIDGLQMFQCPVCGSWWKSETEVNHHVDECLSQTSSLSENTVDTVKKSCEEQTKLALGVFLSGGPSNETMDVFVRIFRNILKSPDLEKYRKIRLSNPKIQDTIGMALGGMEVLEAVGFHCQTEEDEIWVVMGLPSVDQIKAMQMVISELEACILGPPKEELSLKQTPSVQRKVDRQVRVFYAAPENLAAKIELPESFFQLSAAEHRQEAAARKKKLEDSQLLISKTSREKLAAANKRRYKATIIRIQFPDRVVLQGMFLPWEPTTAIYEFVSTSLRNPSTQFNLLAPGLSKKSIVPAFDDGVAKIPTLEEANLVPAVLLKFQCAESDLLTFTGLRPDMLEMMESLSSTAFRLQ